MLVTQLHQEKDNATPRLGSLIVVGKTKSGGQKSFIYHEGGVSRCLSATDYKQPVQVLTEEIRDEENEIRGT